MGFEYESAVVLLVAAFACVQQLCSTHHKYNNCVTIYTYLLGILVCSRGVLNSVEKSRYLKNHLSAKSDVVLLFDVTIFLLCIREAAKIMIYKYNNYLVYVNIY